MKFEYFANHHKPVISNTNTLTGDNLIDVKWVSCEILFVCITATHWECIKYLSKNYMFIGCAFVNTMGYFQDTTSTFTFFTHVKANMHQYIRSFEVYIHHINHNFIKKQAIKYNCLTLYQL